ncbi:dihydrolipoyl dehydrogenase [Marinobacter salinisoli]|uniref:Dihydrolipoyl dehydrogenase n=1 Tax=Marinobacter salinisoli TaxID=2769486 RepID=A0ABX7MS65_9GAMM|nr:dihydrolipoyl dehydrogenase [Marinobacter salinisoli]QSP95197.1 dihydrolipoyl dehydrogenase [Marinobacter salinisoli]
MEKRDVDVAIIGAGSAGMVAYQRVRKATDRVVMIEASQYGTTCARVGCMPSKLLIAAAESAHQMATASVFGIKAGEVTVDGQAVMARIRQERDQFVDGVIRSVEKLPDSHRVLGHARFADPHRLMIDTDHDADLEINADRIIIATGSRPVVPKMLEEARDRLIVNDDVFEWQTLPDSVAVFGPGVIGLELGQALSRLGIRVRMFGVGGSVGPIQDPKIRDYALKTFNNEFPLDPDSDVKHVARTDDGVAITYRDSERGQVTETFDYLLAATGRQPNVDGLDIQNADIDLNDNGVPRFDAYTLRCGDSHIFIAGDANDAKPLLHEAADEGRIAGDNAAAYPDVRAGNRRPALAIVFTDPQIASVGMTLQQVDEACQGYFAIGEVSFEDQGRSRIMAKNRGLLRVYARQGTGLFLGAELFGPAAEHMAHLLAWSLQRRLTVPEMLEMPFYHPVVEEGLRTALKQLNRNLSIGHEPAEGCMECGPGV